MKLRRKLLALLLAAVMVLGLLPAAAMAEPLTEDIDVYGSTVWLVPPEGKVVSCEAAELPAQFGTDYYPEAVCLDVTLTGVEDDASFTFDLRSNARSGRMFDRLKNYICAAGFTYAQRDDLFTDDSFYVARSESEAELYTGSNKTYSIPVQLENGAAWVILYYYTYSWQEALSDEDLFQPPIALILHFQKEITTLTEDVDVYDGKVWMVPPEGKVVSCEAADVPEQFGTDYYPEAVCMDVTLTGVEDDASFTFDLRSNSRSGRIFDKLKNYICAAGFTYAQRDDLFTDDSFYVARSESEAELYTGSNKTYSIPVQLENGAAWVILYYYTYSWQEALSDEDLFQPPIALVLNFHKGAGSAPLVLTGELDDVLTKLVPEVGQIETEYALYHVPPTVEYDSRYSTYLIVPKGTSTVNATLTFDNNDYTVTVNGVEQGPISEDNTLQVSLSAAPKNGWEVTESSINKIKVSLGNNEKVYTLYAINQRFDDLPDRVVDFLCIGSQYTNQMGQAYGVRPVESLVGSNYDAGGWGSGPVSLGNFGGYIIYEYDEPLTDNPNNPYGIDFITFGNSVEGSNEFGEVGQVWVSEDGSTWYALAGGMHYEDYADWDYTITYTRNTNDVAVWTEWTDSHGNSGGMGQYPKPELYPWHNFDGEEESVTLSGIYFDAAGTTNAYGNILPPFAGFGYTDMGARGTTLNEETGEWGPTPAGGPKTMEAYEAWARNIAGNPYLPLQNNDQGRIFSSVTDGMDLAWAVDADGQPVDVSSMQFHYVKIVTASNIDNAGIGEKSTEVNMVRVARANETPVGKTDAPAKITVDGAEIELVSGQNVYNNVPVCGAFAVSVDAPEGANVYINNNCDTSAAYDAMPTHKIIRVIVQEGEKEPWITILNLVESETEPNPTGALTLDANGGTVNGEATYTYDYDASMLGQPLPEPVNADETLLFEGWFIGQQRYSTFPEQIGTVTLTAHWSTASTTPSGDTITVSFRLIGSTLAEEPIDLADGDYHGAEYVTWIPTGTYTVDKNATVADLFIQATNAAGIQSVGADRGYVSTVYAPASLGGYALSEFTNGPRSGWMYTKNGVHTNAINVETMEDGDVIIFHYVNDYAWEVADWGMLGGSGWPQLSDSTNNYWSKWLTAADTAPGGTSGSSTSSGDKKDETKPAEMPAETTTAASTVTADDGSTVKTETEKVVDTTTNEDGSVTETVTETTKTTVTTPDNVTTVTETVVETETTTDTVKNDDGSVTDKTETVEKVTETVTGEDGKQTTTVTETAASSEVTTDSVKNADGSVTNTVSTTDTVKETVTSADGSKAVSETTESKSIETTVGADGKTTGAGTVSATTTVTDESGKTLSTAVTEGTVAVSTDDKGTVSEVTTATTKTTDAVTGEVTEETTVTTEAEMANGTTGKTVENEKGETLSAEANVSEAALQAAQNGDGVIELPITVNTESGATVQLNFPDLPDSTQIWAEIGTTETSSGDVAYLKLADGVVKLLPNTKTGSVIVPVNGSCEVIVKDNSKSFTDVDTSAWYGDSVKFVTAREIFNGNGDGTFAPGATMNRAMAAQIIFNFDGATAAGTGAFSDVAADAWYAKAVAWAAAQGIVNGYNGAYSPLGDITRQDLVKILYFYAQHAGYDVEGVGSDIDLLTYADGADVSDYAAAPMRWAIASGLIQGYADNTLRPRNTATRAEVAAIMQRMVMNVVK